MVFVFRPRDCTQALAEIKQIEPDSEIAARKDGRAGGTRGARELHFSHVVPKESSVF